VKLTCTGADLSRAAAWAAKIAPSKPSTPVMAGVLLDAGEVLTLSATDYETFGTAICSAIIQEPGRVVVSARLLAEVANAIPAQAEASMQLDGSRLVIKGVRSAWRLPLMDLDLWPTFPTLGEQLGRIPGDRLACALKRVVPTLESPGDISRQILTGVLMEMGESLTLTGSDGKRVARLPVEWESLGGTDSFVVAGATVKHINDESDVIISTNGGVIGFNTDRFSVTVRPIDGKYPEVGGIMAYPVENVKTVVMVDTQEFQRAIADASVGLTPADGQLDLSFSEEGAELTKVPIRASSDDENDSVGECDVHQIDGPSVECRVKRVYLADALAALGSKFARFTFSGAKTKPFLVQPCDENGEPVDEYRHVAVPLNKRAST
jgi:DNA polymerase III subunit beta